MGKKFVGLDGLKHFWTQAKIWIAGRITGEVTARIAEVVANAPEDLDTLKEIADWISAHADSASEMNTQITENKNNIATNTSDIAALQTSVSGKSDTGHTHDDRYYTESEIDTKLSGKADKAHTHTKSEITDFPTSLKNPNALTVNGKTYDGSSAVNAGVQTVANGGTGVTTQKDINRAFIGNLDIGSSDVTDGTEFISSWASNNGFSEPGYVNMPFRRKFSAVWNYIKGKISSVLGLTKDNYGGKASTAGTADKVASAGSNGMWIQGRSNAICKTTSAGASAGWKTLTSIKTSSGSIEIGNLSGEDFIRIVYSSDTDVNAGNNNVSHIMVLTNQSVEFPTAKASSKMVIPIGAPSSLEDGCIWIER